LQVIRYCEIFGIVQYSIVLVLHNICIIRYCAIWGCCYIWVVFQLCDYLYRTFWCSACPYLLLSPWCFMFV